MKKRINNYLTGRSIQLKIYGMVLLVVFLVTIISLIVVSVSVTNALSQQIEDRAKSISSDIASRSVDPFLTHNIFNLQTLINDTLNSYEDIEYIFIVDEENHVIVHSNKDGYISQNLLKANHAQNEAGTLVTNGKKLNTEKGYIFDSATPILSDFGGEVRVGLTYRSLDAALAKVTSQMMFSTAGVLLISGLIVFGLTRILTLPISNLVQLTNKVSSGNLTERIHSYPRNEIGKLTNSFNHMLDALEKSENQRKEYFSKINIRNKELTLLNRLSQNFKSEQELKEMLQFFVKQLVKDFNLKNASIVIKSADNNEHFCDSSCELSQQCNSIKNGMEICKKDNKELYFFPLQRKGGSSIGNITICSLTKLDKNFINILNSLAVQLSVSVENLELWKEVKKKEEVRLMLLEKLIRAQEEERKRIARELHDETSHTLSSMLVELKMLEEGDKDSKYRSIDHLRNLVRSTIEELHKMAWQLRPTVLDKFGLKVAIERYVQEYQKTTGITTDLVINAAQKSMHPELETTIYRLVQESLTNIIKYAKADSVSVIILSTGKQLSIVVEDDGVGFDVQAVLGRDPSKDHLGLLGMHERIALFHGTLQIESQIGEGTTVFAKIPLVTKEGEVNVS